MHLILEELSEPVAFQFSQLRFASFLLALL
jgi:hypothetical protein